jgi:hypothetical protein
MHAAVRPYIATGVALLGASIIAVTPVTPPPPPEIHVAKPAVRLAADASVLNIPINLIQDIFNIPYNEVQAINNLGESLLFTGTWLLASSTNVWGTDPGDPGHYYGLTNLFPFPAFSNALAAQLVGLAEVLFPINSGCDNNLCPNPAGLTAGWLQRDRIRELLTTGKYTFDDTPVSYPDGTTHPPEGLWNAAGPVDWGAQYNHPEWDTLTDPATGQPIMPWAGTTFTLDLFSPFTNYVTHLMSDPTCPDNTNKLPTLKQIGTAFTNLAKGLVVAFSPIFPGSPWCLGLCGPTYGPESALRPPFYRGQPPTVQAPLLALPPVTTTASPNQNSAPVSANAISIPQGSGEQQNGGIPKIGAQQSEARQQNGRVRQNDAAQNVFVRLSTAKPVEEPPALQKVRQMAAPQADQGPPTARTANGTSNASTTTSTNPPDVAKKPTVTDDGGKFEPRQVSGNDAPRTGLAGGANATVAQAGPPRSANPRKAFNGGSASVKPVHSGKK